MRIEFYNGDTPERGTGRTTRMLVDAYLRGASGQSVLVIARNTSDAHCFADMLGENMEWAGIKRIDQTTFQFHHGKGVVRFAGPTPNCNTERATVVLIDP